MMTLVLALVPFMGISAKKKQYSRATASIGARLPTRWLSLFWKHG